ncbi:MAG: AAA family ATPase [Oscillospiraceae bacterium]|nr:AAA family ATPase [Oscillospiraceae bacterium]
MSNKTFPQKEKKGAAATIRTTAAKLKENLKKVITGKDDELDIIISAVLAKGHILIEDIPGTGKTVLAKALAKSVDAQFKRVQFTPDLLPGDVVGVHIYNLKTNEFTLKKGAVFTNILLGDEINRATPRTQSALLECMEERQVTIDGQTFILDEPFIVLATQNPIETGGVYPLPEAQLDRFLIEMSLGYPDRISEEEVLSKAAFRHPVEDLTAVIGADTLIEAYCAVEEILLSPELVSYIVRLGAASRNNPQVRLGVSTRGLIAIKRVSKAYAAIMGRSYVTPDDIKKVAPYVMGHRLILKSYAPRKAVLTLVDEILNAVDVPTERIEDEDL